MSARNETPHKVIQSLGLKKCNGSWEASVENLTMDQVKEIFGPFTEPLVWTLTGCAVYVAYQRDARIKKETSNYPTYTLEEAKEMDANMVKSYTVFDKM